jgi:putative endonuclease
LLGARAEAWVADLLTADGWTLLARNWRGGGGELDVVVKRDGCVRFVEVKARSSQQLDVLESLHRGKLRLLRGAARAWLRDPPVVFEEACFLVALVDCASTPWSVEWIDNAFDGG